MESAAPYSPKRGRLRSWVLLTMGASLLATAVVGIFPTISDASSHREAPLIQNDRDLDNTDFYAFVSPDDPNTVTFVGNWHPFSEPIGGPEYYPWNDDAVYDFNIDNDGDAKPDITYRWEFETNDRRGRDTFLYANGPVTSLDDENLLFRQNWTLTEITDGGETQLASGAAAPSFNGPAATPDYGVLQDQAITAVEGGGQTYVGQADDSFFLDLRVFDLLFGGDLSETGVDTFAGYNVNTIALQVPLDEVALDGDAEANPVIGTWTTTGARGVTLSPGSEEPSGDMVQVSRLGNPLVNEVVVPTALKDAFNSLSPSMDAQAANGAVVEKVRVPIVPMLVEQIYGIPAPETPRDDLFEIFLTGIAKDNEGSINADLNSLTLNEGVDEIQPAEMLRLNMSIPPSENPNRLGLLADDLQGFPNGRRLTDDVVDIGIQVLEGAARDGVVEALAAGDRVNANDEPFSDTFPYVALPNMEAVNQASGTMPSGGVDTGAGGLASSQGAPAWTLVSGALALLLLGAGTTSLLSSRRRLREAAVS